MIPESQCADYCIERRVVAERAIAQHLRIDVCISYVYRGICVVVWCLYGVVGLTVHMDFEICWCLCISQNTPRV